GLIDDVTTCTTMDFKNPGGLIYFTTQTLSLDGSVALAHARINSRRHEYAAVHDISDGGLLTAVAECCIASGLGAEIDLSEFDDPQREAFARGAAGYVIELASNTSQDDEWRQLMPLGKVSERPRLVVRHRGKIMADIPVS